MTDLYENFNASSAGSDFDYESLNKQIKKLNKQLSKKGKGGKKKKLKQRLKKLKKERKQLQSCPAMPYPGSKQQPIWWQTALTSSLPEAIRLATVVIDRMPKNSPDDRRK